jgi:hypothetical protein
VKREREAKKKPFSAETSPLDPEVAEERQRRKA